MSNNRQGLNALDFLMQQCNESTSAFQKKLTLNDSKKAHLQSLINEFKTKKFKNTKEKGMALENLTKETLKAYEVFEALPNIHTSTNEIDFLCKLTQNGRVAKSSGYLDFEEEFLIECKNYRGKVDVTFIGKFAALLQAQSKNFGIMISQKGLTGKGWNAALGLTKKIYLKTGVLIISFTLDDFETILNNSFFEVIEAKRLEIINDTKISHFLIKHPAME